MERGSHSISGGSLVAESDAPLRQVVGRHLHPDLVAGKDLDIMHAHLASDVSGDFVAVLEFDAEHCIGERFDDDAVLLDC